MAATAIVAVNSTAMEFDQRKNSGHQDAEDQGDCEAIEDRMKNASIVAAKHISTIGFSRTA